MQNILLKKLSLINFKGARNVEVEFLPDNTFIYGDNGTGKTTLFDAFTWLLFGKDSQGRADFGIKTIDPDTGRPYPCLEHSVAGVLSIDGKEVSLQRKYVEVWTKPNREAEEKLSNHKTEFFINGVKLGTKKEYDSEVSGILSEDLFRIITNPYHFFSLKPDQQKELLFAMSGGVSDEEVSRLNPEYMALLEELSGANIAKHITELSAKKKAIKEELKKLPAQIEMAERLKPKSEDWDAISEQIETSKKEIQKIDEKIADKSKVEEEEIARITSIRTQINEKKVELSNLDSRIEIEANGSRSKAVQELNDLKLSLTAKRIQLEKSKKQLDDIESDINKSEKDLEDLRAEFRGISAEEPKYTEGDFVCPTCKRPLDVADIESKQAEILENFNEQKSAKMKANREKGTAESERLKGLKKQRITISADVYEMERAIEEISLSIESKQAEIPESMDTDSIKEKDPERIKLLNEIADLENQLTINAKTVDTEDLQSSRKAENEVLQELYKRIAKREQIEATEKEIARVEGLIRGNNEALAELEGEEYVANSFIKDKDNMLLGKINELFDYTSFSFINEQLNGGEKVTCVCSVNGTPYPDVNAAGKLNAGIDIINAICRHYGVTAPIFIDNRESVNEVIPSCSQIINLVVTRDKYLTTQ